MSLFDSLKDLGTKIFDVGELAVDNLVFRLHRIGTVVLLLTFSVVTSLGQYVGDPIECIKRDTKIDPKLVDTYCWIHGTYTHQPPAAGKAREMSHLDFASCNPNPTDDKPDGENCWHHAYYQFVVMVLVCQAACFYFPWFVWQLCEEDRVKSMVQGLDKKSLVRGLHNPDTFDVKKHPETEMGKKVKGLIDNWMSSMGSNDNWALKFYICEIMNLANAIAQFFFTDYFLDGHFQEVGYNGLFLDEHETVMPILASCAFTITGTGGSDETYNNLCVLPPNMLNQKFFSIWFVWLTALILISAVMLVIRLAITFSAEIRELMLNLVYSVKITNKTILKRCSHGDWFMLSMIMDNMNVVVRSSFIKNLEEKKKFLVDEDF